MESEKWRGARSGERGVHEISLSLPIHLSAKRSFCHCCTLWKDKWIRHVYTKIMLKIGDLYSFKDSYKKFVIPSRVNMASSAYGIF